MNTNFYSLWFDPTGNRTRVYYRFSSRRSIHSTTFPPKNKNQRSSPKLSRIYRPKSEIVTDFRQKPDVFQKVFTKIESSFSAKITNSNGSSGQIAATPSLLRVPNLFGGGGLFSFFKHKSASKALKTCNCAYFSGQWGGIEPPSLPPPLATLLNAWYVSKKSVTNRYKIFTFFLGHTYNTCGKGWLSILFSLRPSVVFILFCVCFALFKVYLLIRNLI